MTVKDKFVPFLQDLLNIHREKILSVFIYGSATGKNYIPKISDINSVCVFHDYDFSILKNSLAVISRGMSRKIAPPLFLTKKHMESLLDVFPLEFLDMKDNYVLVYGEDVLQSLEISGRHIRLLCEHEIKGKLIRIRQAYLEAGRHKKNIKIILRESLNSLLPVFRNVIRLKNQQPAGDKENILKQLCREFNLDDHVFLPIYKDRTREVTIAHDDAEMILEKYIVELQKLAHHVDQL